MVKTGGFVCFPLYLFGSGFLGPTEFLDAFLCPVLPPRPLVLSPAVTSTNEWPLALDTVAGIHLCAPPLAWQLHAHEGRRMSSAMACQNLVSCFRGWLEAAPPSTVFSDGP